LLGAVGGEDENAFRAERSEMFEPVDDERFCEGVERGEGSCLREKPRGRPFGGADEKGVHVVLSKGNVGCFIRSLSNSRAMLRASVHATAFSKSLKNKVLSKSPRLNLGDPAINCSAGGLVKHPASQRRFRVTLARNYEWR